MSECNFALISYDETAGHGSALSVLMSVLCFIFRSIFSDRLTVNQGVTQVLAAFGLTVSLPRLVSLNFSFGNGGDWMLFCVQLLAGSVQLLDPCIAALLSLHALVHSVRLSPQQKCCSVASSGVGSEFGTAFL